MPSHAELAKHFWEDGAKKSIDESGIKESLRRALNDFTPRTEEIKKKITRDEMLEKLEKKECGFLTEFVKYFKETPAKNQDEFDKWHHEMCKKFLGCFNDNFKDLQYGKAQKIVNMTFKNIYCLRDAESKEDYFKYCHMPLDSLTLEWFYRKVKPANRKKKYTRAEIPAWSKLCYESEESASKLSYKSIQKDIREHFESRNKKSNDEYKWTPLTAEFVIWPQIQLELAAEGLFNQLWHIGEGPDDAEYESCKGELRQASKIFKSKSVKDKLDYLKQHIDLSDNSFIFTDVNT